MFQRITKSITALLLVIPMTIIVSLNLTISYRPALCIDNGDTINYDVIKELRGLEESFKDHADDRMQSIYPEGYLFLNALYALTWSEVLNKQPSERLAQEARAEIQQSWRRICSSKGSAPFSEALSPPYGSFYSGWSAYVLGTMLRHEPIDMRTDTDVQSFERLCADISEGLDERPYPESYPGGAWPADVMIGVAALALHDKIYDPKYEKVIDHWLTRVKKRLDKRGMIPHSADPNTGEPREDARGSSQALMLIFLRDIDPSFAAQQFKLFKQNFVNTFFGLTGVREYPKGVSGHADSDSGPVILGFGGAATIVGIKTLALYGEQRGTLEIRNTVEALALACERDDTKTYLFGKLPLADAFIAWSHSSVQTAEQKPSFVTFRIYSLVIFVLTSILFWFLVSRKADDKNSTNSSNGKRPRTTGSSNL